MKRRIVVITDNKGEIVGTQAHEELPYTADSGSAHGAGSVFARLVPGPGQKRHEVEIELPARFSRREDITRFHADVKSQLHAKT
jgi:hypothetical protein